MVDFKSLVKKNKKSKSLNLVEVFESLDRQASHTDLRESQTQALTQISAARNSPDIVLKINTGAGKTTVALLYLFSHMEEKERPVVYLCPTIQLVKQVLEEAERLGIKAVHYKGGETHPSVDGLSAKAIIVCTYDKMFNAKSTFNRTDVDLKPCAIVLDDAHAGVEEIRDCFTLNLTGLTADKKIKKLLGKSCKDYLPPVWRGIENNDPEEIFEVPYWIWKTHVGDIWEAINEEADEDQVKFVWPHLKKVLRWCRCVITCEGMEIAPDVLPVDKVPPFAGSEHRMFMSATLADDSVLVRELGCDPTAASTPIVPSSDKGLGERMVLTPSLISKKLDRNWVMNYCSELSKRVKVVVICSNKSQACEWEQCGATVVIGDEIENAVADLRSKSSKSKFYVFVQRYDGIDLPDQACRILVLDGMPHGEGIIDKLDGRRNATSSSQRNRLTFRIEQGMGRAVRSHVDYAAVILVGDGLASFIAKHEVQNSMNPDTKLQMRLALKLTELAIQGSGEGEGEKVDQMRETAFRDMVFQCLSRNEDWKQFYEEEVRSPGKDARPSVNSTNLALANAEREAFTLALRNQARAASDVIFRAIHDCPEMTDQEKGFYMQKAANYLFEDDPATGLEKQLAAFERNEGGHIPPKGVVKRPKSVENARSSSRILAWFKEFHNPNGIISHLQELKAKLDFSVSAERIEAALLELAKPIGAQGSRPEKMYGEGPDDLWLWDQFAFVIEAKTGHEKTLHKSDAGQFSVSMKWYSDNFQSGPDGIPVIVARVHTADKKNQFPDGTRVMTESHMSKLIVNLENFYSELISKMPLEQNEATIAALQVKHELASNQFLSKYTRLLE